MIILDVNTNAVRGFTKKLGMLNKSAFPNAVRAALNSAAFDVKQVSMPKAAKKEFTHRQPNFFKANSKVVMAQGFDVKSMQSIVGFTDNNLKGGNNYAVKDLKQQEKGGIIKKRSFIPLATARVGNSLNRNVRAANRLGSIKNITVASKAAGKNDKQKFIKSVAHAGAGGTVLSKFKGRTYLWRVNSLKRTKEGKMKLTALYSFKESRYVRVSPTGFMRRASMISADRIEGFYIKAALKRFNQILR